MSDLISVVLPVYNVEKYIRQALDSVINQTYKNLEIILVDDGSPDNSGSICDEYASKDNRIRVIHKENGGVSSARNAGIDMATGDWLYFMDPDDWIELNTFELVMDKIAETKADMCFFDNDMVYNNYSIPAKSIKSNNKFFFNDLDSMDEHISYNAVRGSSCVFIVKSQIVKKNIRYNTKIQIEEDYLFKLELYQYINSFAYIPIILYHYRSNPFSAMNSKKIGNIQMINEIYNAIKKIKRSGVNFDTVANSYYLNTLNRIVNFAYSQKPADMNTLKNFINSDLYNECKKNYDLRLITGMAKIIVNFKKPTLFKIHCVYVLRKIKKFSDRIKYILHK